MLLTLTLSPFFIDKQDRFEERQNQMKLKAPNMNRLVGEALNGVDATPRHARDVILSIESNYPWLISRLPRDHSFGPFSPSRWNIMTPFPNRKWSVMQWEWDCLIEVTR